MLATTGCAGPATAPPKSGLARVRVTDRDRVRVRDRDRDRDRVSG